MKENFYIVNKAATKAEIMIYGFIGEYDVSAKSFVADLRELEKEYSQIDVRINSGGGSVFEGIAIYNAIKASTVKIDTYIDGLAASMGSIIALAGNTVHMSQNAQMMTHKPSSFASGNSEEMRRNAELLDQIESTMLSIYAEKTGKDEPACQTTYMNGKDNWFTASQALSEGLIDVLYDLAPVKKTATARSEKMAYEQYAMQLATSSPALLQVEKGEGIHVQKPNNNTMEITLTAESLTALGLPTATASTSDAINTAIAALANKATKAVNNLAQATAAHDQLEQEFTEHKANETKTKIEDLLASANEAGKISVAQKVKLAAKYHDDFAGLKELVEAMPAHTSITEQLEDKNEVAGLVSLSKEQLFRGEKGGWDRLKAIAPEAFKTKYKEAYGTDYKA